LIGRDFLAGIRVFSLNLLEDGKESDDGEESEDGASNNYRKSICVINMSAVNRSLDVEFFSQSDCSLFKVEGREVDVQESSTKIEFSDILWSTSESEEKFVITIGVNLNVVGRLEGCFERRGRIKTTESEDNWMVSAETREFRCFANVTVLVI
jgi:hypothetical protein